ncbi:FmdB family zinc ribbon protein [Desulfofustis glycolicus]|uniref:Putative regulatory protein, FmdB family n=1 Tax=Desulfofustis glycolicus DSM 9705 TaxID=1121409 RepID=A0A1M5X862_9BACT|nr:zinc ribbon domain-containing protein [Desulfofustis glycolicus]MCB2218109.1 zinc ribbon domain-containing protein [Desulfobulbaceae bacterium]SHH96030.1 putative regulatory protein, FmdB family [Desulfofustis glycolicus DSM 9705]
MPIYEFYCQPCNTVFNFYSKRIDTTTTPNCPRCGGPDLQRQVSMFATIGKASEEDDQFAGLDENRMEQALESLMRESEGINEDDPRQMAGLMRKFSEKTGINLGENMEEAIARMERGEDPEQIEQEMGELFEGDDFSFDAMKKRALARSERPRHDETLYDLHPE